MRKKFNTWVVNKPNSKKGMMKPIAYKSTSIFPNRELLALEARISTDDNIGPIHGVQAKLNVNPITSAINGFTFLLPGSK